MTDADIAELARRALAAAEPRFRVLRQGPRSQALRLEPFWWTALEAMALRRRVPPAELVFGLLDGLPAEVNRTAFLRCCIGADLEDEARRLAGRAGASLLALMREAPAPAFIVSNLRGLVDINARALREIERRLLQHEILAAGDVEIRKRTVVDPLFAALRAAAPESVENELPVKAAGAGLSISIRATLFPAAAADAGGPADWAYCHILGERRAAVPI